MWGIWMGGWQIAKIPQMEHVHTEVLGRDIVMVMRAV
jgi:hypothetical protein